MDEGRSRLDAYLDGPSSWSELTHLATVDSTNDEVVRRVRAGGPAGMVVVADEQTAGRGRHGRTWQDLAGGNLSVSVATGVPDTGATLVPLATGLAVADALARRGLRPVLKWPNDVLLPVDDGRVPELRKVAGILAERHDLRPDGPAFLVVGIGIDLDWRDVDRVGDLAAWTSIAEIEGGDVDRWGVLADLLRALASWLLDVPGDPTRLLAQYRVRCGTLDRDVRVTTAAGVLTGRAVDLDRSGGLVVEGPAGREVVMSGEVEHVAVG